MWTAVITLLIVAAILGAALGYASVRFKPEGNPIVDEIDNVLPQTQCGQCGYPGCRPYAEAIAGGDKINKCPPGGEATIQSLADLLDVEPEPLDAEHGVEKAKMVAVIREDECIGCTKCIQACPVDAILGAAKQMHTRQPDCHRPGAGRMNAPLIITDRAHRFHGGVHPADNKAQSNSTAIETLPLPPVLVLPLRMHLGAPAEPRVSGGMTVLKGDILADADGAISAAVHAPTSGRIVAIEERIIAHESGLSAPCIVLEADGEDAWRERQGYPDWRQRDASELIQRLRDCGLAGLGGAGFPTDVKYRNTHHAIDTLIINAAECEPYITADDRLMRERATEILEGAAIAASLVGATTIRLGIEDNKPEALAAMTTAAQALELSLRVTVVPTKYPSGGEKQLIQLITGQEVPAGGLPSDLGIICQNVGTLAAIRAAIIDDEPLIRRVTTVTGAAADRPGNYEVLIGTKPYSAGALLPLRQGRNSSGARRTD